MRAFSTWRGPASPRNCQTSSAHWARPVVRRAGGFAFDSKAAGRIGDDAPPIGIVAVVDETLGPSRLGELQPFIGQNFVDGEAIMQFRDVHVVGAHAGFVVDPLRGIRRQIVAHGFDQARFVEAGGQIGRHGLRADRNIHAQSTPARKAFGDHNGGCRAACRRTALQPRDRSAQSWRRENILDTQLRLFRENRTLIVLRVFAGFLRDHCKGRVFCAEALLVFAPRAAEQLDGHRCIFDVGLFVRNLDKAGERDRPVRCRRRRLRRAPSTRIPTPARNPPRRMQPSGERGTKPSSLSSSYC